METGNQRILNPATARAFIRNLANKFEDPQQMLDFVNSCEMAQAALADWLFKGFRFDRIQQTQSFCGILTELESRDERETVWNEYHQTFEQFQLAKERLKQIISELDMASVNGLPMERVVSE